MSWGWRKLLQIWELVKPFLWKKLRNGISTSLWFDRWNSQCPLIQYITPRDITREGFNMRSCVADVVSNKGWMWPNSWLLKAPNLGLIKVPILDEGLIDMPIWRDLNDVFSDFLVRAAWEALRSRDEEVSWYHVVWYSHNIPRHAFHFWLVMRNSLKTQDRVRQWDMGPNTDLNTICCMELIAPILHDILLHLQPMAHRRTAKSVIGRLLVAAASYYVWVERNNHIFKNTRRTPEELCDAIMVTVRLKLLTFRFKNTVMVNDLLGRWKMPKNFRLYV
ncbi:retrotransposon protein, putative, ty1-copia subclass [Tanacetum coccineum]